MPNIVVVVPPHLAALRDHTNLLHLVYTYHESWYNDETQFDGGKLELHDGIAVCEIDEGLLYDIGEDEQSIIEHAVSQGWFGNAPLAALKQQELDRLYTRIGSANAALLTRRSALRLTLEQMAGALSLVEDKSTPFTAAQEQALQKLSRECEFYLMAQREQLYLTKQVAAKTQELATLCVPVTLDQDVRTILGA